MDVDSQALVCMCKGFDRSFRSRGRLPGQKIGRICWHAADGPDCTFTEAIGLKPLKGYEC